MRTAFTLFLLSIISHFSYGQITYMSYNCDAEMCGLFFNLDLDSSKTCIEKQIPKIPEFHFLTTDKFDTLYSYKGNYHLYQRPTIPGMPCFYSALTSLDQFKPDSLKIFLGGGGGIMLRNHEENLDDFINGKYVDYDSKNVRSYAVENVEIIRDFNDPEAAIAAYDNLCAALKQLCYTDLFISEMEIDGKRYWSFPLSLTEEESKIYHEKRIHVDFYPPGEGNKMFTVRLTYSKSIWNDDSIE